MLENTGMITVNKDEKLEAGTEEVDVEEIMKKIKAEVARRKLELRSSGVPDAAWPDTGEHTGHGRSAGYTMPGLQSGNTNAIHINDLLKFNGEAFIYQAYMAILKRDPDAHGIVYFLSLLDKGKKNKIDILGSLRYSREGKEKRVKVKGLFFRYILNLSYRLPAIGYALRLISGIVTLPMTLKHIQDQQAIYEAMQDESNKKNNAASEQIYSRQIAGEKKLSSFIEEFEKTLKGETSGLKKFFTNNEDSYIPDSLYANFTERFRGTRDEIKNKQAFYLPYVKTAGAGTVDRPIVDLGCGRGEWLEILKNNGLIAKGIDLNSLAIKLCSKLGLDGANADSVEFLKSQRSESYGAITGFHIVEHLQLKQLVTLIDESLRTLKPGGILIFETPNPENVFVGSCNFYIDPTHNRPIPPVTLRFFVEQAGFEKVDIVRLHRHDHLENKADEGLISILNTEQDYSVIAHKPMTTVANK